MPVGLRRGCVTERAAVAPERGAVKGVVQRQARVESVLEAHLLERRVHGDERRYDNIVEQLQQHVQHALAELHPVRERRYGGRQVGRRSRVRVELTQSGGDQQNERNVEVVG